MITTKRCQLVRFSKGHTEFYHTMQNNIQVRKHLGGIPSHSHINESISKILSEPSNIFWIVNEIGTDEAIGVISLEHSTQFNQVELSYEFMPNWWGQGYAHETVQKVLEHAFNIYALDILIAVTQSANLKSRALLEKSGMKRKCVEIMFDEEQSIYQMSKDEFLNF